MGHRKMGDNRDNSEDAPCSETTIRSIDADEIDEILTLLSNVRRRYVLSYFVKVEEDTASIDDIVSYVLDQLDESSESVEKNIRITLAHKHIPKIDDYDIIEYNPQDQMIQYHGDKKLEHLVKEISEVPQVD